MTNFQLVFHSYCLAVLRVFRRTACFFVIVNNFRYCGFDKSVFFLSNLNLLCIIMNRKFFALLASLLFVFAASVSAFAQNSIDEKFSAYSKLLSPEKLYLHTDRDFYCVGDTLWFKAYLLNNSLYSEFPESNFVYVELIGFQYEKDIYSGKVSETKKIIERVKAKRRGGIIQGYVPISSDMNTGKAILRAYTYWGLNFPSEYIYSKNLEIVNPMKDRHLASMKEKNVRERDEYTKIGVAYPFDKQKDIKDIECGFFAESGRLVDGIDGVVAFKALAEDGLSTKVSGIVYNAADEKITEFESDNKGFGKFILKELKAGEKYHAVVTDERGVNKKVELPAIEPRGIVINIERRGANFISKISVSSGINTDSLMFILHDGSEIFYNQPLEKAKMLAVAAAKMRSGIVNAAVVDGKGNVYAERPFFNLPQIMAQVEITPDKQSYAQRENASIGLSLYSPTGRNIAGDLSIAVTDNRYVPYKGLENNILSYMMLGSEIKGYIEDPQWYFDLSVPYAERVKSIDLLMLTQGWVYYDLQDILKGDNPMPKFGREYIQTVSGRVKATKKHRQSLVSFVAPSINFSAIGQLDTTGYFELKDISFPDSTLFIVNAVGTSGKKSFIPYIDDDSFAPMLDYYRRGDSTRYDAKIGQELMQRYYDTGGDIVYQLDPLYVTAGRKIKAVNNPSPIPNRMFKKGQLREGADLEPYKNYDLMTYINETCQGLRFKTDTVTGDKILVCRVPKIAAGMTISDGWEEILVFINGASAFSSSELQNFMVSDVSSVVYVTGSDAAPFSPMMDGSASIRSVVMIQTALNERTGMPRNVTKGYPLGWQKPVAFYSPVYDYRTRRQVPAGADRRSTVYWNPALEVPQDGKSSFEFSTSDGSSPYTIVIEGITTEGDYIFKKETISRHVPIN